MALTLESEQRLRRVELTAFFEESREEWLKLAKETYEFMQTNFPEGVTIRRDDIAKALVPLLEVKESLIDCLNEKKLKQKYWISDFCDLIIDRTWQEISE